MRILIALLLFLLVIVVAAIGFGTWAQQPVSVTEPIEVIVAAGDGAGQIAAKLDSTGILRSRRAFVWLARWQNIDRSLRPGKYRFEGDVTLSDILSDLHDGRAVSLRVTIPEGWTVDRIAARVAPELGFSVDSFLSCAKDTAILNRWAQGANGPEGYLWPETYQFFWGVEPDEVLVAMLTKAWEAYSDSLFVVAKANPMSRHQVLTLASMIEAEAALGDERGRISGVFHNRLQAGWPLQCDPTVVYAIGGLAPGSELTRADLAFDSPYNTYLYTGLPPGPICNPGMKSLWAALRPDSTFEMYFVADGQGGHIFSRTLDAHNTARARVKRDQRH